MSELGDTIPLMVRYLDLSKESVTALDHPEHPSGRYVNLDDFAFVCQRRGFNETLAFMRSAEREMLSDAAVTNLFATPE